MENGAFGLQGRKAMPVRFGAGRAGQYYPQTVRSEQWLTRKSNAGRNLTAAANAA